jgi:hypothetical protein
MTGCKLELFLIALKLSMSRVVLTIGDGSREIIVVSVLQATLPSVHVFSNIKEPVFLGVNLLD